MSETGIFAPSTVLDGTGDVRPVSYGDLKNFHVTFYMREVLDEKASKLKNRRIVKPVEYCRKEVAGDNKTIWDAPVSDADKHNWPQQYAAFQRGESEMVMGTPLDAWPMLTADHRAALKNMGFKSVEQIRDVTDSAINSMSGGNGALLQNMREHALKWLEEQESGALEQKLTEALAQKENEMDVLKNQMAEMAQQMNRMQEQQAIGAIPPAQSVMTAEQPVEEPLEAEALANIPTIEPDLPEMEPEGRGEGPEDPPGTKRGPGRPAGSKNKVKKGDNAA